MTEYELLITVKKFLGLSGNDFHDNTLLSYIDEVKQYMLDSGVSTEVVDSSGAAGVIARGVSDLWNYGSGNATLSPYFFQRAIQLVYKRKEGVVDG